MEKEFITLYSVKEVAEILDVTTRSIRNYLKNGTLKGKRVGGQWRFSKEDVEALMTAENREKSNGENLINEFMDFGDVLPEGNIRACAVYDYYCTNRIDAEKKAGNLRAIIAGMSDRDGNLEYEFMRARRKARFVFTGSGKFVEQVAQLINR